MIPQQRRITKLKKNMEAYIETGFDTRHLGLARNEGMEKQGNRCLAII